MRKGEKKQAKITRLYKIEFWVTAKEKFLIESNSRACGMTRANYARDRALKKVLRRKPELIETRLLTALNNCLVWLGGTEVITREDVIEYLRKIKFQIKHDGKMPSSIKN